MHIEPSRKILQSILAILQHRPGVAILNAVSDPVFLNFESGFSNGESGFSQRRVRIFFESESGFSLSPSPGFEVCQRKHDIHEYWR